MGSDQAYPGLSGISKQTPNPYDALIEDCADDSVCNDGTDAIQRLTNQTQIQARYEMHRQNRNAQQKSKFLEPSFSVLEIDPILFKLVNQVQYPHFEDHRHCLVFWTRPTQAVRNLVKQIQENLKLVVPSMCSCSQQLSTHSYRFLVHAG